MAGSTGLWTVVILVGVLLFGISLGRFMRPDRVERLRIQHQEAEIQTKIEEEHLKQDRLIRERMQS